MNERMIIGLNIWFYISRMDFGTKPRNSRTYCTYSTTKYLFCGLSYLFTYSAKPESAPLHVHNYNLQNKQIDQKSK